MGHSGHVSTGEHRGYFRGPHGMLQRETNCRSGPPCSAAADRIHNHEHGPAIWPEQAVHVFRGPRFFYAILREIAPHRSEKFFGIRHDPILHRPRRKIVPFAANGANSPFSAPVGPSGFEYAP